MLVFTSQMTGFDSTQDQLLQQKRPKLSGKSSTGNPGASRTSGYKGHQRGSLGVRDVRPGPLERYPLREKSDAQVLNSANQQVASTLSARPVKRKAIEKESNPERRRQRRKIVCPKPQVDALRPDVSDLNMSAEERIEFVTFVNRNFRLKTTEEMNMVGARNVESRAADTTVSAGTCSDTGSSSGPYNDENIAEPNAAADTNAAGRSTRQQKVCISYNESGPAETAEEICKQFVPHKEKKGWVICRPCGAPVWPPNCRKHAQQCRNDD